METTSLTQQGNTLKAEFKITHAGLSKQVDVTSPQYICGPTFFQVNVISSRLFYAEKISYSCSEMLIFIKFSKVNERDHLRYTCNICSDKLKFNLSFSVSVDSIWYKIYKVDNDSRIHFSHDISHSFDITVSIDLIPTVSQFAGLYEDIDLTDLELKGTDGSVKMHKNILANSSPVLKTMLLGDWKETAEGSVNVTGTTKQTLAHFKDYIYLQKLPDSGLEQLLLLASYYIMPELEQKVSVKLLNSLTAQNAFELLELAVKNKLNYLAMIILEFIANGAIKVKDTSCCTTQSGTCKEADE